MAEERKMEDVILKLSNDLLINKLEQDRIRYNNIYPEKGFIYKYKLPVKELDDIPVNLILCLYEQETHKHIELIIESSKLYLATDDTEYDEDGPDDVEVYTFNNIEINRDDDPKYTVEFIQEALRIVYNKLSELSFDKYTGYFVNQTTKLSFEDWKTFLNIEKVTLDFNECCVCLEMTSTQTKCNHYLCYKCWSNLKYTSSDNFNEETFKCPYCRDDISF
jgi:hypothetical protein